MVIEEIHFRLGEGLQNMKTLGHQIVQATVFRRPHCKAEISSSSSMSSMSLVVNLSADFHVGCEQEDRRAALLRAIAVGAERGESLS
jgi:hypothetical protein